MQMMILILPTSEMARFFTFLGIYKPPRLH